MKQQRRGVSLGTILALCLTAVVSVGFFVVYRGIRGQPSRPVMQISPVAGLWNDQTPEETRSPDAKDNIRTVTVTLAPSVTRPPAAAETPIPAPARYDAFSFDLTISGMISFQSDISDALYDKNAKSLDYTPVLSLLREKIHADLNMTTLNQVINPNDLKYADVQVPAVAADAIRAAGFDDVNLCTEHVLDQGEEGAAHTIQALTGRGLSCGGVTASGTRQHRILQLNGARIAVIAYTDSLTAKGKNAQEANPALLQMYQQETARREIQSARAQGASLVIVCMYWGRADASAVTNAQRTTARVLAEMGADVILGYRPTRVLPMELITTLDANGRTRQTFVAYSMGTLVSESRDGYDISGVLLHMHISGDEQGRIRFSSLEYTPTYIWRQAIDGKTQYRVVCSADPAPVGMEDKQRQYLTNALNRIQKTLQDSPAALRP